MIKLRFLFALVSILFCFTFVFSDGGNDVKAGTFSVGMDEGALVRVHVLDYATAYVGFGYKVVGPDTVENQPLQEISFKLGGEFAVKRKEKFRLYAFAEWKRELIQSETAPLVSLGGGDFMTLRMGKANNIFRIGIRPELFITNSISIDYKMGLQYIAHGADSKLNDSNTALESLENEYSEFGFYSGSHTFSEGPEIILNIGLNIYLGKLPVWPL